MPWLRPFRTVLFTARHSGASLDGAQQKLGIIDIQKRRRWERMSSVNRHEKRGVIHEVWPNVPAQFAAGVSSRQRRAVRRVRAACANHVRRRKLVRRGFQKNGYYKVFTFDTLMEPIGNTTAPDNYCTTPLYFLN